MLIPSTTWMILAAATAASLAAAAFAYNAVNKRNRNDQLRKEKTLALAEAEKELYAAVRSGDANRCRAARVRLQALRFGP